MTQTLASPVAGESGRAARVDGLIVRASLVAAFLALVVPVLVVAMPPLLDYPNHFARFWLIMGGADQAPTSSMYAVSWTNAFTNIGLDLVAGLLKGLVSAEVLSRVFLALAIVLPPLGAVIVNRAVFQAWHAWQVFLPLLAWNLTLMAGFLNFQIGIGMALLFASLEPGLRGRPVLGGCIRIVFGTMLILTHLFPYCLYLLVVAAMAFGPRFSVLARRATAVPAVARVITAGATASLPILAYVVLLRLFPAATLPGQGVILWQGNDLTERMGTILSPFRTYDIQVDAIFIAALVLPLVAALVRGRIQVHAGLLAAAVLLAALSLVMPKFANDTAWIEKRLPLMAVLVGLASLRPSWSFAGSRGIVAVAGLGAVVLRVVWVALAWHRGEADVTSVRQVLDALPRGASLFAVGLDVTPEQRRMAPLARYLSPGAQQPLYWNYSTLAIAENGAFVRSLFASPGKQPIVFKPPYDVLRNEGASTPIQGLNVDWARVMDRADWQQRYDYLLILNADIAGTGSLPAETPTLQAVADRGFARLYRIRKPGTAG